MNNEITWTNIELGLPESIKEGDVVRLKSGSPNMTVGRLKAFGWAEVYFWLAEPKTGPYNSYNFYQRVRTAALEKVN